MKECIEVVEECDNLRIISSVLISEPSALLCNLLTIVQIWCEQEANRSDNLLFEEKQKLIQKLS